MKQIMRYLSVFVLLLCSTMAFAASKVEMGDMVNGTITGSLNGQTCTLTVTPASGYYIRKSDITVQKSIDPSAGRTRSDIPVADLLTLTGDDPAALSTERTYTFVIPEGYDAYVTATFTACTAVTVTAEDKTKVEGEVDPELTAKVEGLIGDDKVTYTLSRAKGEDVGEYAITVTGDAAQGIYAVTFVGAKLTITAKPKPSGDVNDDGVVNIADVVALSRAILAGSTDQKYDINGDGSINAKDITALVALIANL